MAIRHQLPDRMAVFDGKTTEHWSVANLYSVLQQIGAIAPQQQN